MQNECPLSRGPVASRALNQTSAFFYTFADALESIYWRTSVAMCTPSDECRIPRTVTAIGLNSETIFFFYSVVATFRGRPPFWPFSREV